MNLRKKHQRNFRSYHTNTVPSYSIPSHLLVDEIKEENRTTMTYSNLQGHLGADPGKMPQFLS